MGVVRITSLNPKFSGSHFGLPPSNIHRIERFRAGHFTCKNTDWEKWREPIRKVEPETTDWALHTRIPVRIEPSHFMTAAECWSIAGSEDTQSGNFYFSVSFFSLLFQEDDQILEFFLGSRRASNLFIYIFIFFACHATVVVVVVLVVVVTGFVLERLFASVATVGLEVLVGPSAVKHHRFFLEYCTAILSYLESIRNKNFEAHPKLATPARNRHVAIFRYNGYNGVRYT